MGEHLSLPEYFWGAIRSNISALKHNVVHWNNTEQTLLGSYRD